jgi:hypothetical protein
MTSSFQKVSYKVFSYWVASYWNFRVAKTQIPEMSTFPEPVTPGTARMREVFLMKELVGINDELAALGLDPAVSTLDQQKVLPLNCVGHAEFDQRVKFCEERIATLTKEEAKYGLEHQKSLKRMREMSPDLDLLPSRHMKQMRDQLESTHAQSSREWTNKRRELMQAKIALNKYYETYTSMDEDEYHRVLGELLDRKLQVHKALLGALRLC